MADRIRIKKEKGLALVPGANKLSGGYNFAVEVPEGVGASLALYKKRARKPSVEIPFTEEDRVGNICAFTLPEFDAENYEYNFLVDGKVYTDPCAYRIYGRERFGVPVDGDAHKVRCGFLKNEEFDWEGDKSPEIPYHEMILYKLHVRGYTKANRNVKGVKGTFQVLEEMIPYWKELGINAIELMPAYEFMESGATGAFGSSGMVSEKRREGRVNFWGYMPGYYFAPKAAYAAFDDAQTELKDLVKVCHKAGIEVVLEMPFTEKILPQTVLECLRFYLLEYHVDGFVVNPYNVPWDSLNADPILKGAKIFKKEEGFQNSMRRFLKGDEGMVREVIRQLCRRTPEDGCCNYITSHTGFTLCDLVSYDGKHNEANGERNQDGPDYNYSWNCGTEGPSRKRSVMTLRKNQMKNAFLLLLLSQGTPCILAGDEFGNTQDGNNNVYCQDNETAWLNWGRQKSYEDLFRFVKRLIALRKSNPVFHQRQALLGLDRTACGIPDVSYHGESAWQVQDAVVSRQLGVLYSWEDTFWFVAYNMHWEAHEFALPALKKEMKWYQVAGTEEVPDEAECLKEQKMIEVKARTIILLQGR